MNECLMTHQQQHYISYWLSDTSMKLKNNLTLFVKFSLYTLLNNIQLMKCHG